MVSTSILVSSITNAQRIVDGKINKDVLDFEYVTILLHFTAFQKVVFTLMWMTIGEIPWICHEKNNKILPDYCSDI